MSIKEGKKTGKAVTDNISSSKKGRTSSEYPNTNTQIPKSGGIVSKRKSL